MATFLSPRMTLDSKAIHRPLATSRSCRGLPTNMTAPTTITTMLSAFSALKGAFRTRLCISADVTGSSSLTAMAEEAKSRERLVLVDSVATVCDVTMTKNSRPLLELKVTVA